MDPGRYSRLSGSGLNNPLTRSEGFWMEPSQPQSSRPAPEDIGVWKELIKSQGSLTSPQQQNPQNPQSLAMKKKALLPGIGSSSPRSNALGSAVQKCGDGEAYEDDFEKELCFKKSSKRPQNQSMRKSSTFLDPNVLSSTSFDVFPSESSDMSRRMKNTRLRPLGIHRLSSVPEGRGPSAFHTRQLPPVEQDIPERPLAPTPLLSPRKTRQARAATPRTTHRTRDYSLLDFRPHQAMNAMDKYDHSNILENVAPAPSPECDTLHSTEDLRPSRRPHPKEDIENRPPSVNVEAGKQSKNTVSHVTEGTSQVIDQQNVVKDELPKNKEHVVHADSTVTTVTESPSVQTSIGSSSLATSEQSSQNKRPSQDNDLEPTSDNSVNSPLNKRRSYLELNNMYLSHTNQVQKIVTHGGDEQQLTQTYPQSMSTNSNTTPLQSLGNTPQ